MAILRAPPYQKKQAFHLSGIHEKIPSIEILSILASLQEKFSIVAEKKQCLIIECSEEAATIASQRAAYCHRALNVIFHKKFEEITQTIIVETLEKELDFNQHLEPGKSYMVRVYHIGQKTKHIISMDLEKKIGYIIRTQTKEKNKTDLKNPETIFTLVFCEEEVLFGKELYARKKGFFKERRPDLRPYFKPGTLEPRFARLMANLAQTAPGELLYDPFCGPGGILVEAAIMGFDVLGSDLNQKMLKGAKRNITFYASESFSEFFLADSKELPLKNSLSSLATDPPYGRSTSTYGKEIIEILEQFFEQAARIIKKNGILALSMSSEVPIKELAEAAGFQLQYLEKLYIHKSLTRNIGVFKKR